LEALEGRALLSAAGISAQHLTRPAGVVRASLPSLPGGGPGLPYILNALQGGAGHEWIELLLREQGSAVSQRFPAGVATVPSVEYRVNGLVAEDPPYLLSAYRGRAHDRVAPMVAGAVVLKNDQIELGAIMRGPFTKFNGVDYLSWGINRGEGVSPSPALARSDPWLKADAVVTLAIGPNVSVPWATLTDLTTGKTQMLSLANVQVIGPVARVLLSANQLPSKGLAITQYQFAFWSESDLSATPGVLAGTAPRATMLPIGVEIDVSPTMG